MLICLSLTNNTESNLFLRALWSIFEEQYGHCGWLFLPHKIMVSNKIFLGRMSTDLPENLSVSVWYKKRGVIDKLEFTNDNEEELSSEVQNKIRDVVETAKDKYKSPIKKTVGCSVKSVASFANYKSELFMTGSSSNDISSIIFQIECYGEKDGQYIFAIVRKRILDMLSVLTNLPFYQCEWSELSKNEVEDKFFEDDNYMDGYSLKDKFILLPSYSKIILERIIDCGKDIEDDSIKKLLSATGHFHAGRKFDAQVYDTFFEDAVEKEDGLYITYRKNEFAIKYDSCVNLYEMAVVSYISALEVIAMIVYPEDAVKCECCGQMKYSISHKVKGLLIKYLGECMGKEIHKYYSSRSKFLHAGIMLSHVYVGTTIPQLDASSDSGAESVQEVPLLNLREYVGYCIRCVIKEYFLE